MLTKGELKEIAVQVHKLLFLFVHEIAGPKNFVCYVRCHGDSYLSSGYFWSGTW